MITMKKNCILVALIALLASCNGKTQQAPAEQNDTVKTEQAEPDVIAIETRAYDYKNETEAGDYTITFEMQGEWPTSENAVGDSIREWIHNEVMSRYDTIIDASSPAKFAEFTESYFVKNEQKTKEKEQNASRWIVIAKDFESDSIVTYHFRETTKHINGTNAAVQHGATFRKRDGHRFTWADVKQKAVVQGRPLSLAELLQKFMPEYELRPNANPEGELILPSAAPYCVDEGLMFLYGWYEISGQTEDFSPGIIPYSEMMPFLGEEFSKTLGFGEPSEQTTVTTKQ